MSIIKNISSIIARVGIWFVIASYGIMIVVTLLEVFRRYFFGLSFEWAEELVRFLLVSSTFIGGSVAYKKANLVFFDLLQNKLSKRNNDILNIVNSIIILVFLFVLLKLGYSYMMSPSVLLQKSPGLGLPMVLPYAAIPTGVLFMVVFTFENIGNRIRDLKNRGDEIC
ncbi:TRAP transporter small permease [Anoxybacterium hadale]|uniref:TRAP transporter small permease n=1 Tax=Anoxybacterium hadale TaxID=3408580 RepID=A0ACD1ADP9_9FIRM|nr:TRAP transporter small permease [Clostridiales bacterium]